MKKMLTILCLVGLMAPAAHATQIGSEVVTNPLLSAGRLDVLKVDMAAPVGYLPGQYSEVGFFAPDVAHLTNGNTVAILENISSGAQQMTVRNADWTTTVNFTPGVTSLNRVTGLLNGNFAVSMLVGGVDTIRVYDQAGAQLQSWAPGFTVIDISAEADGDIGVLGALSGTSILSYEPDGTFVGGSQFIVWGGTSTSLATLTNGDYVTDLPGLGGNLIILNPGGATVSQFASFAPVRDITGLPNGNFVTSEGITASRDDLFTRDAATGSFLAGTQFNQGVVSPLVDATVVIPEPSSIVLLTVGLIGVAGLGRRKRG